MRIVFICVLLPFLFFYSQSKSQEKTPAKFGNVKAADFATKIYAIDSNANAIVLADVGSTEIEGNSKGWFSLEYSHYKRIHILNKNGFDAADVSIRLYSNDDDEEKLNKLKAVTYNLENGKVVETKLNVKNQVFKDKLTKNWVVNKFTFPNVQEGSIIEFQYTITSDFLHNLQPWEFQGGYPRIWSEYSVGIPNFLGYVFLSKGDADFDIKDQKEQRKNFNISASGGTGRTERYSFDDGVMNTRWVKKNVPALIEESFTSSLDNHISKIEFQLSEYRHPLTPRKIMGDWNMLAKDLLESEYFGAELDKDKAWLREIVNPLVKDAPTYLEKAQRIYNYVQSNYTCTNYNRTLMDSKLKDISKKKTGNVAELNILLATMLRSVDISADPVILSTRDNGMPYPMYPLFSEYNYVIVRADLEGKVVFLDASDVDLGFGKLPVHCYNGTARVITAIPYPVDLYSDELEEKSFTNIMITPDAEGNILGRVEQRMGYYESLRHKEKIKKSGAASFKSDLEKNFDGEITIVDFYDDTTSSKSEPLKYSYTFKKDGFSEDIIYINPMFDERYKENPFKSVKRYYPVEMPYRIDETYTLSFTLPEGYEIDEMPKGMVLKLNEDDDGVFEYRINHSGGIVNLRCRLKLDRAYYLTEEYDMLREFFNYVVKKQAEQIVLKKKL